MDDFRKSFEYEEDKRGAILYFVVMLITIDILLPVIYIVQISNFLVKIPPVNIGFIVICFVYILFLLFTALICYKLKPNFVLISKKYLIIRTIFITSCIVILCLHNMNDKSMIGIGKQYSTMIKFIIWEALVPLSYVLLTSGGWYLYFLKSKRCNEIKLVGNE